MVAYLCLFGLCASYFSIKHADMQDKYVHMQDSYVNMQHNYVQDDIGRKHKNTIKHDDLL